MPLRFIVSPDLPAEINSLTLAYNFMKLTSIETTLQSKSTVADDRFKGNLYVSQ
jgi:cytochrome c oxidase assembly protein Cox11